MKTAELKKENLPKHVAIIADGNRRWARRQGLSQIEGHKKVVKETTEELTFHALELGIPYITFWFFSTENWKRGEKFANSLFRLGEQHLLQGYEKYDEKGIRLNTIGNLNPLPETLKTKLRDWSEKSSKNKNLTVTLALNYGGRDELIRAIGKMGTKLARKGELSAEKLQKLTQKEFAQYLDTAGLPDPDLIIRTGKAKRLSGFMLWQSEYAELYFTETLMPDFSKEELNKALTDYIDRQRRFGR
jgi:undecaprenyl diphosphate synthase